MALEKGKSVYMQKYKEFVETRFAKIGMVVAIIVALAMTGYFLIQSTQTMSANELKQHIEKLRLLKEDFSNLSQLENVSEETAGNSIIVTFDGKECDTKAIFSKDGTYMYHVIIDDRPCTNFGKSFLIIFVSFLSTWFFMCILEAVLWLPIVIAKLYERFANKQ